MPDGDLAIDPNDFVGKIRDLGERSGPQAVSPAGAMGTMQVLPSTAQSPGFGLAPVDPSDPQAVEKLGQDYARAMLSRYSGNQVLASAAYNAGPGRVDQWIKQFGDPRSGQISNAAFSQLIPFGETQGYINRVAGSSLGTSGVPPQGSPQANPIGLAQASPLASQVEPSGSRALALMQMLLPKSHKFVPVDYDPFAVENAGRSQA